MTITEYFSSYQSKKGKADIKYPLEIIENTDKKFSEFYKNSICRHLDGIESNVMKWHEMFLRYAKLPDAVFWVRRYESCSEDEKKLHGGRWVTRRGCKTEYSDGFSYVFVSNFEAHEIFNMVRLGVEPDEYEFLKLMKSYEYPMHYDVGGSCEESDAAAYPAIGSMFGILSPNHWYLAHILGVNETKTYTCDVDFDKLCPRGEISDWKDLGGRTARYIDKPLSPDEKRIIIAHFLRLVDPINYYVVPGKNYQKSKGRKFKNGQIGEHAPLSDYVSLQYANLYGEATLRDYRSLVLAYPLPDSADDEDIHISYQPLSYREEIGFTEGEQLATALCYLKDGMSLMKVEETVFGESYHGNTARKILRALGVDTSSKSGHKGLLAEADIDGEIAKADGAFKRTLEKIKNLKP